MNLNEMMKQPREKPSEKSVRLWAGEAPGSKVNDMFPWLDPYLVPSRQPVGAVLVCAGGGYGERMPYEGSWVAERFNRQGLHAFSVNYRVAPHRHPEPLMDISRALRIVRARAREWNVSPNHLAVCGFSAGGHLAASIGTLWHRYRFEQEDDLHHLSNRPDAIIPCYPVISGTSTANFGSFNNLLGEGMNDMDLRRHVSPELNVTEQTPPAFLWHCYDDSVEESLAFAAALRARKVRHELHLYDKGGHGWAVVDDPSVSTWIPLCCQWLRNMGWYGK